MVPVSFEIFAFVDLPLNFMNVEHAAVPSTENHKMAMTRFSFTTRRNVTFFVNMYWTIDSSTTKYNQT